MYIAMMWSDLAKCSGLATELANGMSFHVMPAGQSTVSVLLVGGNVSDQLRLGFRDTNREF